MSNSITATKIRQYRNQKHSGNLLKTVSYNYTDEHGKLLYQVVREQYEIGKSFHQRRPDGKGGWINNLTGVKTTIYRLPEVIEAVRSEKIVFIVEGEKDVETLRNLQLTATTNPMGAGKWKKSYNKYLKDANVVILPDNDDIGKKHAEDIAEGMIDVAHSIKIVELPDLEEHEDITDWITKRSGTKEKLLQLVVETPQYKKTFRRICLTLGKSDKNSLPANAAKACEAINKLGVYYWKSGMPKNGLGEILFDHNGVPTFHLMSKDDVFNAISKVAYSNENKKGLPPKEIASYVYEMPATETPFRPLEKITRTPVFSSRGQLICEPGYYAQDRLLYIPHKGNIRISPNPTKEEIRDAKALLEDDILVDFNFVSPADKTHAIAYILLFFCREMIDGPTPLHIFEAAKQGTGKTLLAESMMKTLTLDKYSIISKPDDEELRKKITSSVLSNVSGFCLDNVVELKSPLLAQILLTQKYNDRQLGTNRQIDTTIRWVWAATGNNITVDTDMARRSIRIRFVCDEEHPELRPLERFKHPNLHKWCRDNADRIIQSGLTLIQAWIAAGCPIEKGVNYGGFEKWAELMGSILAFHGFSDFLGNVREFFEEADKDAFTWRNLLEIWWSIFKDRPVTAGDLLPHALKVEGLYLGRDDKETSKKSYLSRLLNKKKETVTTIELKGEKVNLQLKKEGHSKTGILWSLQAIKQKIKIYQHDENCQQGENPVPDCLPAKAGDAGDVCDVFLPALKKFSDENNSNNKLEWAENASLPSLASPDIKLPDALNYAYKKVTNAENPVPAEKSGRYRKVPRKNKNAKKETKFQTIEENGKTAYVVDDGKTADTFFISQHNIECYCTRPLHEIDGCIAGREVAFDLETINLHPRHGLICVVSIACGDDRWIVQFPSKELLETIISRPKLLIGHNIKFDLMFVSHALQKKLTPKVFDTELAARLIEGNRKGTGEGFYSLKSVAQRYLNISMDKGEQKSRWYRSLSPEQVQYCLQDVEVPLRLYGVQQEFIEKNKLQTAAQLEFGCVPAVAALSLNGVPFDVENATMVFESLNKESEDILRELPFNPHSTQQILKYFRDQNIHIAAANKETLPLIDHPMAQKTMDYRKLYRYTDFVKKWIENTENGRIYANFHQIGTETGRFSCSDPNIQQVPRMSRLRQLFRASDGYVFADCDWTGVELRIMAQLSKDPKMKEAFTKGKDLHIITAAALSNKPEEAITKDSRERQLAKAVNFGLIYGMGPDRFRLYAKTSFDVNLSKAEAEQAKRVFFDLYREIKTYHRTIAEWPSETYCLPEGERQMIAVRCASGRVRLFEPSVNYFTNAVNHPDQGTGADMLKEALTRLHRDTDYRIVLPVHDEILLEVPEGEAQKAKEVLKTIMLDVERKYVTVVPAEAEAKIGPTWADAH